MLAHEHEKRPTNELWKILDLWQPEPISLDFDRRLYAKIEQSRTEGRNRFRRVVSVSSVLIALLAAFFLSSELQHKFSQGERQATREFAGGYHTRLN